jgi:peroxiredoxin
LRQILIGFVTISLFFFFLINPTLAASAASLPPSKGGKLPVINLQVPKDPAEKLYLGLSCSGFFRIPQIKAQAVVIKIFNVYCPICVSTTLAMNDLYHQIENNPNLKNRIKLIGIGTGNSLLEVAVFKETHKIHFPIFPDEDFRIHKVLGEVRTPFFIAIKMERDGSPEIVHTHLGGLTETGAFLDFMLEAYGIDQEDLQRKAKVATSTTN